MNKFTVNLTLAAQNDLDDIAAYIALTLRSPKAASDTLNALEEAINSLDTLPFRFPVADDEYLISNNVRFMPVKNFIIYYAADEDKSFVNILRIAYSRRDVKNVFPNNGTIEALNEGDRLINDPDAKRYKSIDELKTALDEDEPDF